MMRSAEIRGLLSRDHPADEPSDHNPESEGGRHGRELEGLQHEIATLARRQSTLEDDLLELMEQREQIEQDISAVAKKQEAFEAERTRLIEARDADNIYAVPEAYHEAGLDREVLDDALGP